MKLEDLGYNSFFENKRNELNFSDFSIARVTAEFKEAYKIINENGEFLAKITGKQMFEASQREDYPAIGDWVAIEELSEDTAVIRGTLPRATMIKRIYGGKTQIIATNIDVAFVVESIDRDYNLNRFERYFALAKNGGVKPVIIINKVDLISSDELSIKLAELKKRFPNSDIICTSTVNKDSFDEITALAQNCQYFDCTHIHEPGCEVIKALKSGELDQDKYSNYLSLKKEVEYYEMDNIEKREDDRQFG